MSELRKDAPIYYKCELKKLINQAKENGLKIRFSVIMLNSKDKLTLNRMIIDFEADNGDIASAILSDE